LDKGKSKRNSFTIRASNAQDSQKVGLMNAEQPIAGYIGKPEIDDGHTKIANELLDAIIQTEFSKRQLKILLYIMRKTYGWNKPEDDISRSQMVEATRLHNPHITKTIQELLEMNVIIVSNGNHAKRYKINKYYDTWRVTDLVTITKPDNVTNLVIVTKTVTDNYQNSNNSLPKQYPQKTITKDNTKDICIEVLNHLNSKAKKNFKPVKANLDLIKARLKEYSEQDLKAVIDSRVSKWINDPKMNEYLRPSTLFNATKCAQYISEGPSKAEVPAWKKGLI
jgi:phage replication O-like protein O